MSIINIVETSKFFHMLHRTELLSNENGDNKGEILFPSWKSLIYSILNDFSPNENLTKVSIKEIDKRLRQLDVVKQSIKEFHPAQIIQMLSEPGGRYLPEATFDQLLSQFKNICIAKNQFYTVYDINVGWHVIIDEAIRVALGINPEDFSLLAMAGLDPKNPLFHPEDVNHMIRWASLGYLLLSFPGFKWRTLTDYYYVSHRVGTAKSSDKMLRAKEYITLEKRCFPLFGDDSSKIMKPIFHFDQWSVLDASEFEFVKPKWITSQDQSEKMNGLFYLFNAYLLNLSPKHLIILRERSQFDRNKAVANSLNAKIMSGSNIHAGFDEIQIGNVFSKTIRDKISQSMNVWDKRTARNLVHVRTDAEAVHYGKVLGLLPMPEIVERLIYSSIYTQQRE